ncbi:MAG: DUF1211 domain-containing protein [Bacteroidetes bacterium]|nr:DUF1211 domain-containing protein [Bacteroidota bacterium]MBS1628477.1 DUF1211 domain-containing protein [Bacteroidota bacterium]
MKKSRLEAFSDGVIAIIITIMVLELKVPHGDSLADLAAILPIFLAYILSFLYVAIYWHNHHHLLQLVRHINGRVLLANTFLLFWLSLVPFATAWMGENGFSKWPVVLYGLIMMMCGGAYNLLEHFLIQAEGAGSLVRKTMGNDRKARISVILYLSAIGLAFLDTRFSLAVYALVAGTWLIPDRRAERHLSKQPMAEEE